MEAAVEVARTFGRVVVVAPETTQSGMSQAITMYSPLYLRCVREEEGLAVYAFSGTPVDCVKMAFDCLLRDERVDLVLSGINHGSNSAVNVLYSGTIDVYKRQKSNSEPPATASSRQTPPVTPADQASARSRRRRGTSPLQSRARANAPSTGTAHWTTTSVIETVRNLSYPGRMRKALSLIHI